MELINSEVKKTLSNYPNALFHGIATYGYKTSGNSFTTFPSIIDGKGGAEDLKFGKNVAFIAYHRAGNTSYSIVPGKSYGDGSTLMQSATTEMQMLIRGNRAQINFTPEDLAAIVSDSIPAAFDSPSNDVKASGVIINVGIQYDQRANFNQEYTGIPYTVGPDEFFLSIRYRIQGSYLKGCINKCAC